MGQTSKSTFRPMCPSPKSPDGAHTWDFHTNKCEYCGEVWQLADRPKGQIPARDEVKVDHETGLIHVPGAGDLPLVGPTSGREYEDLKKAEAQFNQDMSNLRGLMRSKWRCTQCRSLWPGTRVRVKKLKATDHVAFVCPDKTCDAPVVREHWPAEEVEE